MPETVTIGSLPAASALTGSDMIPLERDGNAMHLTGDALKAFIASVSPGGGGNGGGTGGEGGTGEGGGTTGNYLPLPETARQNVPLWTKKVDENGKVTETYTKEIDWTDLEGKPFDYGMPAMAYANTTLPEDDSFSGDYFKFVWSGNDRLVEGQLYQVRWNNEYHICPFNGGLGNMSLIDSTKDNTREPFAVIPVEGALRIYGYTGKRVEFWLRDVYVTKKLPAAFLDLDNLDGVSY